MNPGEGLQWQLNLQHTFQTFPVDQTQAREAARFSFYRYEKSSEIFFLRYVEPFDLRHRHLVRQILPCRQIITFDSLEQTSNQYLKEKKYLLVV